MKFNFSKVEEARYVLSKILAPTPLLLNHTLSQKYKCNVYLKLENMQPVGSFKIRGASNKIASLTKSERQKGVVAMSAGNHAQGVAWAARHFKVKSTIVMPTNAPISKIENTKNLGAKVILHGASVEESFDFAKKIEKQTGSIFVHPYEDELVIYGQGTMGLEILNQLPNVDLVIGSIGGGGMLAGVANAIKELKPSTQVIGAQAFGARSMAESLKKNRLHNEVPSETFADGIRIRHASSKMFDLLHDVVDQAVVCNDEEIAQAVLLLLEKAWILAEGAGALPVAVLDKIAKLNPAKLKNKNIVLIICGGNIDINFLYRIIEHGLTLTGRRLRLRVFISDKPGSLNTLTKLIAENSANILQVIHDRDSPTTGLKETGVELTLEMRNAAHSNDFIKIMKKHFPKLEVIK